MRYLLVILWGLFTAPALAASVTCPNGSICLPYVNAGGTIVFNPSATIANGTATNFLAWCHAYYIATPGAVTDGGCYNTWANEWFSLTIARILARDQTTAASTASAAVTPPAIVPAQ